MPGKTDDFEPAARELEKRAHALTHRAGHPATDAGNSDVVFAIAQFVRVLGRANADAARFTVALIGLTIVTVALTLATIGLIIFQIIDARDEARTQYAISLSSEFFNNANNLAVIEAIDDGGPILAEHKGPIKDTQLDHFLGEFDTIDGVYEHGQLRDEDLCDSFQYYVTTIYKIPEIMAYIKDQRRTDPEFFQGLDNVRRELKASKDPVCR
jgi:hypothetical protein